MGKTRFSQCSKYPRHRPCTKMIIIHYSKRIIRRNHHKGSLRTRMLIFVADKQDAAQASENPHQQRLRIIKFSCLYKTMCLGKRPYGPSWDHVTLVVTSIHLLSGASVSKPSAMMKPVECNAGNVCYSHANYDGVNEGANPRLDASGVVCGNIVKHWRSSPECEPSVPQAAAGPSLMC